MSPKETIMTYQDLILNLNTADKRIARLAWNEANTNVISAISDIAFNEIGNGNSPKAQMLIDLVAELESTLRYKDAE
jgi:uncharacterized SAM-dependent methyltransferase